MKKIILSLVFVFAFVAVTPTSAKNALNNTKDTALRVDCVALAFDVQTAFEFLYDMETANGIANLAYDACMAQ